MSSPPHNSNDNDTLLVGDFEENEDLPVIRVRAGSSVGSFRSSDSQSVTAPTTNVARPRPLWQSNDQQGNQPSHTEFLQLSIRDLTRATSGSSGSEASPFSNAENSRRHEWRNRVSRNNDEHFVDRPPKSLEEALNRKDQEILGRSKHRGSSFIALSSPPSSISDDTSSVGGDSFIFTRRKLTGSKDTTSESTGSKLNIIGNSLRHMFKPTPTRFNEFDDEPSEFENDSFVNRTDDDNNDDASDFVSSESGNEPSIYANDSFVDRTESEEDDDDDETKIGTGDLIRVHSIAESTSTIHTSNFSAMTPFTTSNNQRQQQAPPRPYQMRPRPAPSTFDHDDLMVGRRQAFPPVRKIAMKPITSVFPLPAPSTRNEFDVERGLATRSKCTFVDPEVDLMKSLDSDFSKSPWITPDYFIDETSVSDPSGLSWKQTKRSRPCLFWCCIFLTLCILFGVICILIVKVVNSREGKSSIAVENMDVATLRPSAPYLQDALNNTSVLSSVAPTSRVPQEVPAQAPIVAPDPLPQATVLPTTTASNKVSSAGFDTSFINTTEANHSETGDKANGWILVGDEFERSSTAIMAIPSDSSIVLSFDGTVLASASSTVVEIFGLGTTGWNLIWRPPITGEVVALGISRNGATLAYASLQSDSTCLIQVFRNQPVIGWSQVGQDLHGSLGFRYSISLSWSGDTIALGSPLENTGEGLATVHDYDNATQTWKQRVASIAGSAGYEYSGAVSISSDGKILAVGAPGCSTNGVNSGRTRVYEYRKDAWFQMGQDLLGFVRLKQFGFSVALNKNGSRLAVGAPFDEPGGAMGGQVFIYDFNATTNKWDDVGSVEILDGRSDEAGKSVHLSESGTTLAFSAPRDHAVHLRREVDANWEEWGVFNGSFVSVANDGRIIAVGDAEGNESSHSFVRVLARDEEES